MNKIRNIPHHAFALPKYKGVNPLDLIEKSHLNGLDYIATLVHKRTVVRPFPKRDSDNPDNRLYKERICDDVEALSMKVGSDDWITRPQPDLYVNTVPWFDALKHKKWTSDFVMDFGLDLALYSHVVHLIEADRFSDESIDTNGTTVGDLATMDAGTAEHKFKQFWLHARPNPPLNFCRQGNRIHIMPYWTQMSV